MENTVSSTFKIPEPNKAGFLSAYGKLAKRAEKLGIPAPEFTMFGPYLEPLSGEENEGRMMNFFYISVSGSAPKLNGWRLAASIDSLPCEDGTRVTFLRTVPGETLPDRFRGEWTGECDHCGFSRTRKNVFVVAHDDGRYTQVGSTCLKDFLGWDNPTDIASWFTWLGDLARVGEDMERYGCSRESQFVSLTEILSTAAAVLDNSPWVSSKAAREREDLTPTHMIVSSRMFRYGHSDQSWREICEEFPIENRHHEEGEAIREWGKTLSGETDYAYNVRALCSAGVAPWRGFALAVSIAYIYRKEQETLRVTQETTLNEHFGSVGSRFKGIILRPNGMRAFEGGYGISHLLTFKTSEGCIAKWFASGDGYLQFTGEGGKLLTDSWFRVDATIKGHEEWKGMKQTMLTRVSVKGEVPSPAAS